MAGHRLPCGDVSCTERRFHRPSSVNPGFPHFCGWRRLGALSLFYCIVRPEASFSVSFGELGQRSHWGLSERTLRSGVLGTHTQLSGRVFAWHG